MYKAATYFKKQINAGFAQYLGENVYSSSYDEGEFWASATIVPSLPSGPGAPVLDTLSNLFVYPGGPDATLRFGMAGSADNIRSVQVSVNNTIEADTEMDSFFDLLTTRSISLGLLGSGTAITRFATTCGKHLGQGGRFFL